MKHIQPKLAVLAFCWTIAPVVAVAGGLDPAKPAARSGQIRIEYVLPSNPSHQEIYELMKGRRVLERFREFLSPIRLPGPLLLKLAGCDGIANAWYQPDDHAVTVCYEYLDEVQAAAPSETTPAGVTRDDAIVGPGVEVFLHEIGHAVFDMLKTPILGREEDAADQIAAYSLLQLGKDEARRTVVGVAYMYGREAQGQAPKMQQFADAHALPAQRFYNLLCMAYGADPVLFGDLVEQKFLPEARAEWCADEYKQVTYAVHKLITPYMDQKQARKMKARKWLKPPSDAGQ